MEDSSGHEDGVKRRRSQVKGQKPQKASVKTAERSGRQTTEEGRQSSVGVVGFGLPAALRLAQVGRIRPCISRDVMRARAGVKPCDVCPAALGRGRPVAQGNSVLP